MLKEQSSSFKKVGLIEFPAPGTWAMVFIATEVTGEIAARLNEEGEEMIAVFMPPTPVPTAGFLMFVPRSRLKLLDMTPEEGAKLLISGDWSCPHGNRLPARLPCRPSWMLQREKRGSRLSAERSFPVGPCHDPVMGSF